MDRKQALQWCVENVKTWPAFVDDIDNPSDCWFWAKYGNADVTLTSTDCGDTQITREDWINARIPAPVVPVVGRWYRVYCRNPTPPTVAPPKPEECVYSGKLTIMRDQDRIERAIPTTDYDFYSAEKPKTQAELIAEEWAEWNVILGSTLLSTSERVAQFIIDSGYHK